MPLHTWAPPSLLPPCTLLPHFARCLGLCLPVVTAMKPYFGEAASWPFLLWLFAFLSLFQLGEVGSRTPTQRAALCAEADAPGNCPQLHVPAMLSSRKEKKTHLLAQSMFACSFCPKPQGWGPFVSSCISPP